MNAIGILLVCIIVPATLNIITNNIEENKQGDIYNFDMRPTKQILYLGIGMLCFMALIVLLPATIYKLEGRPVSDITDQLRGPVLWIYIFFLLFGLFAALAPVKGFWENSIRGDDIIISRLWIFKKKSKFSSIAYCQPKRGGIDVFLKGKNRKSFSVDSMSSNITLWFKRLREEGIETNKAYEKALDFYERGAERKEGESLQEYYDRISKED